MQSAVNAKTLEGGEIELDGKAIEDFRTRIRGAVILPGDLAYDEAVRYGTR